MLMLVPMSQVLNLGYVSGMCLDPAYLSKVEIKFADIKLERSFNSQYYTGSSGIDQVGHYLDLEL